jgi:hypothetical protein
MIRKRSPERSLNLFKESKNQTKPVKSKKNLQKSSVFPLAVSQ